MAKVPPNPTPEQLAKWRQARKRHEIEKVPRVHRTQEQVLLYRRLLREHKQKNRKKKKNPRRQSDPPPVSAMRPSDGKTQTLVGFLREHGVLGTLQALENALLILVQAEPSATRRSQLLEDASKLSRLVANFGKAA